MRYTFLLFQLLIFSLPIQLGKYFWPDWAFVSGIRVDYLAPKLFVTDILLLITLLFWVGERRINFFKKRIFWLGTLLFLFLALVNSRSHPASFFEWLKGVEFLILGIFVYQEWEELKKKIVTPLTLAVFYTSLLGLVQFLRQESLGGPVWLLGEREVSRLLPGMPLFVFFGREYLRPFATFSHPNQLAGFLGASLLLLPTPQKLWSWSIFLLGFLVIFLSFSQGAWLALGVVFFVKLFLKKGSFPFLRNLFLPLLFSFSLLQFVFVNPVLDRQRQDLVNAAREVFFQAPFWGVGWGRFITFLPAVGEWWLQPVHNIYLLVASQLGILGLLLTFGLFFKAFTFNHFWPALLFMFITGFFDHYWLTLQQTQFILVIVLAASLSVRMKNNEKKT